MFASATQGGHKNSWFENCYSIKMLVTSFYRASYAIAVLGVVILSVCPSHACFVTNPKNILATFLYHMKGQSF